MSAMDPEISVIVPACNAGSYLSDCLDSIVSQTFCSWELTVIDDGSSDDTAKIAEDFAAKDARINVIRLPKSGVSAARNKGLDAANGRYVAFVDADDKLEPDFLKELHSYAEQSGADITQCSFFNVDEKGVKTPDEGSVDSVYSTSDEILHAHFKGQQGDIRLSVWAKLFRREAFSEIRFDTGLRVYEDAYYVYHCCRKAKSVLSFKTPLYQYIKRKSSVTHSALPGIWPDYFTMYEMQKSECRNDRAILKNIDRREAETGLWLMRVMLREGKDGEVWNLRKKTLGVTMSVIWSSAPFGMKLKLIGVAVMPHIYFAMLRKGARTENEKV